MKDGYLITLNDGTQLEAIPNKNGELKFDIGETSVSIRLGQVTIVAPVSSPPFRGDIVSIVDHKVSAPNKSSMTTKSIIDTTDEVGAIKKCITCGKKYYCATNGCIKTPCGWLCDP